MTTLIDIIAAYILAPILGNLALGAVIFLIFLVIGLCIAFSRIARFFIRLSEATDRIEATPTGRLVTKVMTALYILGMVGGLIVVALK